MPTAISTKIKLSNGVEMPQLGLGVWQAKDGAEVEQAVAMALDSGYRLIDTAAIYGNERGVGRSIKGSSVSREDIFITTKLWNQEQGYDSTLRAFDQSIERLGLDYLDLYLIHWPLPRLGKFKETWRAFERLYEEKRVRAIGVSNFKPDHLEELLGAAKVAPMVNQIELHPRLQQKPTREFCARHHIAVESYSPLMRGGEVLHDPIITDIADSHDKSPAQIVIRWHLQNGLIVIPKSVTPERIRENADVFDFELTGAEMTRIDGMDSGSRTGMDPDSFN